MLLTEHPSATDYSQAHLTVFFSCPHYFLKVMGTQILHEFLPAYLPNLASHSFTKSLTKLKKNKLNAKQSSSLHILLHPTCSPQIRLYSFPTSQPA